MSDEFFGVNGQRLRSLAAEGQLELLDVHLEVIGEGGLSFVRAPLDWRELEPTAPNGGQHSYDFNSLDAWVAALAQHGLRWSVVGLGFPIPDWAADPTAAAAGCGVRAKPAGPDAFAAMMGAVAARYGSEGEFWRAHPELTPKPIQTYEVWNEENTAGFWCPEPDPAAYAALLLAAAKRIHAADGNAAVMLGGLANYRTDELLNGAVDRQSAEGFLSAALSADPALGEAIDIVGIHSYGPTPADVAADVAWFRGVLERVGLNGVPMSLNEVGWTTQGAGGFPPVPEAVRASYLTEVTRLVAQSPCGVVEIAPHTWITAEADPGYFEDWFGLADPATGAPYPSGQAYLEAVSETGPEAGAPADLEACAALG